MMQVWMRTRATHLLAATLGVLLVASPTSAAGPFVPSVHDEARADIGYHADIPAFARKYRMSCVVCHSTVPALTAFGEQFAGNGFRMASQEPPMDTINTGDNRLSLSRELALAIRLDAYVRAFNNAELATDMETPFNLKILSGGTISNKLSYYLYFFLFERGEVGGIEDAFIHYNDIGGKPVDVAIGQFQISDPMFKRELRLEFEDYALYRARIGDLPGDLTYDRGIMATADVAGFTITGEVVNGNGRGEANEQRRFDNDVAKVVFGHVTRDITPNLRLGAMGYGGRQRGLNTDDGSQINNTTWMVGGDATIAAGPVEINGQYIHREDTRPLFDPLEADAITNGTFVEVIVRPPRSDWYVLGLYNYIDTSRPLLNVRLGGPSNVSRYETLTGGIGYSMRTNFRLLAEGTWDMEQKEGRWTLGFVTAF